MMTLFDPWLFLWFLLVIAVSSFGIGFLTSVLLLCH